jgi:hypothetical protein
MSTGGNVPTQGVNVQTATTEKKRGNPGKLGTGSAGSRLKSMWRKSGSKLSLKQFVCADILTDDGKAWLSNKRPGGSDQQRAERKAKGARVRALAFNDSGKLSTPSKKKAG